MNRSTFFVLTSAALASGAAIAPASVAATACISNLTQLVLVLDAAAQTAETDSIRVQVGSYEFSQILVVTLQQTKNIQVSGGWNDDCSVQDAGTTIFDGQNQTRILLIRSNFGGEVGVENITFANATAATNEGGSNALGIFIGQGVAYAARNTFLANRYAFGPSALGMSGGLGAEAVSNLVIANSSTDFNGAIALTCATDATCSAVGNTVFGNLLLDGVGSVAGLRVRFNGGTAYVANNLLWNNEGTDLYLSGTTPILYDNDIGVVTGSAPAGDSEGNFSTAPVFGGGLLNFRMASRSPTINRGRNCIVGGIGCSSALGDVDLGGDPRIQSRDVDIGAFESDVLLYDGLELRP